MKDNEKKVPRDVPLAVPVAAPVAAPEPAPAAPEAVEPTGTAHQNVKKNRRPGKPL